MPEQVFGYVSRAATSAAGRIGQVMLKSTAEDVLGATVSAGKEATKLTIAACKSVGLTPENAKDVYLKVAPKIKALANDFTNSQRSKETVAAAYQIAAEFTLKKMVHYVLQAPELAWKSMSTVPGYRNVLFGVLFIIVLRPIFRTIIFGRRMRYVPRVGRPRHRRRVGRLRNPRRVEAERVVHATVESDEESVTE